GAPARRFGERAVEPHGLSWFKTQKEVKYAHNNWIDEGSFALEFPVIRDNLCELGLGYIFVEPKECNLTLVREFYANWDTSFGESIKVKIRGQVVWFTYKIFNSFLETPAVAYPSTSFYDRGPHTETFTIFFIVSILQPVG
ncbi:hypothetical protein HAX54_043758, partial [Datura stramonium]|nr:hypothetical protein [Datura stramonium]